MINPVFISKVLKSYFFDIERIWEMNPKHIPDFQEKKIREIIKYAYNNVPFYRKKYQKAKINPQDIKTIDDFEKIPFVTKKDLQNASLKDLFPKKIGNEAILTSTSGTKGKPLSIYITLFDIVQGLFGYMRAFREYGINWRKDKIVFILDLRGNSMEQMYMNEGLFPNFKPFFNFENMRIYNLSDKAEDLIKEFDKFQPDFIGGYTGKLTHLALLKDEGYGKNVNPKAIGTTGSVLDKHVRKLAEEVFKTNVYDHYAATEPGPLAFQCLDKKLHIHSDLVYTEFLKDGQAVVGEEPGNIVVTKLYGKGTPIIRYTGMNDIVTPSDEKCDCRLKNRLIKKIYGRDNWYLAFTGGRIMLPSAIAEVFGKTVYDYRTRMFQGIQIYQKNTKNVEIRIIIDQKLNMDNLQKKVFSIIKNEFEDKLGPETEANVLVKEVNKIDGGYIVSKVNINRFKQKIYI